MPDNLFKRDGTYYARYAVGGKLRRVSLRTADLREAKALLKGLIDEAESEKKRRAGLAVAPSWQEAVEAYDSGVLATGSVKPGTAKRYIVSIGQIDPYFSRLRLDQISLAKVATFVRARQAAKATNATIRRDLTTMSRILAFARAHAMVSVNVVDDYDRSFLAERRSAIEAPDDMAVEKAIQLSISKGKADLADLMGFLRHTGLRTGEALRAKGTDIHGHQLTILETKNGRVRTIDLGEAVPPARRGLLFPDLPAKPAQLAKVWERVRGDLEEDERFRLHDLRHAYAIDQIRKGRDIYVLSQHLGHSSVRVTEIYLGYATGGRAKPRKE